MTRCRAHDQRYTSPTRCVREARHDDRHLDAAGNGFGETDARYPEGGADEAARGTDAAELGALVAAIPYLVDEDVRPGVVAAVNALATRIADRVLAEAAPR